MDFKKKLLYKMLVKYYLSDNINASFENFVLDLRNLAPCESLVATKVISLFV